MLGGQFQSLATACSRKHAIAKAFEKRFLAFQHVLVVVDTEQNGALECRISHRGHSSPSKQFSTFWRSKLFKIAHTMFGGNRIKFQPVTQRPTCCGTQARCHKRVVPESRGKFREKIMS